LAGKGVCSIKNCDKPAIKTLSYSDAAKVFSGRLEGGRKVKLCKDHWKEYKKKTKKERMLERWRWG